MQSDTIISALLDDDAADETISDEVDFKSSVNSV